MTGKNSFDKMRKVVKDVAVLKRYERKEKSRIWDISSMEKEDE